MARQLSAAELMKLSVTDMEAYLRYTTGGGENDGPLVERTEKPFAMYYSENDKKKKKKKSRECDSDNGFYDVMSHGKKKKKNKHKNGSVDYSQLMGSTNGFYYEDDEKPYVDDVRVISEHEVRLLLDIRDRINALERGELSDYDYTILIHRCRAIGINSTEPINEQNDQHVENNIPDPFSFLTSDTISDDDYEDDIEPVDESESFAISTAFYVKYNSNVERLYMVGRMTASNIVFDMDLRGTRYQLHTNIFDSDSTIDDFIRTRLLSYILTSMYPNVIMTRSKFDNLLGRTKLTRNNFYFISRVIDGVEYVYCYYVEQRQIDVLVDGIHAIANEYSDVTENERLDNLAILVLNIIYDISRDGMRFNQTEVSNMIDDDLTDPSDIKKFVEFANNISCNLGNKVPVEVQDFVEIQKAIGLIVGEIKSDDGDAYQEIDALISSEGASVVLDRFVENARKRAEEDRAAKEASDEDDDVSIVDPSIASLFRALNLDSDDTIPVHE